MDNIPSTREQLQPDQQSRLAELENTINDNIEGFFKVGHALREIRDKRLYRADYDAFEEYCSDRWDLRQAQAYRQIIAIETIEYLKAKLPADTTILPTCERQVRPLTKLPPKKQVEVWEQVICEVNIGEKLTSGLVSRMIRETLEEVGKKNKKKVTERIASEDRFSPEFRDEVQRFLSYIWEEQQKNWKETTRDALLKHLKGIIAMVEERDL